MITKRITKKLPHVMPGLGHGYSTDKNKDTATVYSQHYDNESVKLIQ